MPAEPRPPERLAADGGARRRHHRHHHRAGHSRPRIYIHRPVGSEISCCVKYTVFGFNVLFWFIGFFILLVGVWAQLEKNPLSEIGDRLAKFYLDPAWFLVMVGAGTFIIGFSGCIGALRENTTLLAFYSAVLGVLLLVQLGLAIGGFIFKDWVKQELEGKLDNMIISYRDDPDLQSIIDWMQKDWLHCCGIHNPDDWDLNIYFNKSSEALGSIEAGGVPFSCCMDQPALPNVYCGHQVRRRDYTGKQRYYNTGCLDALTAWLNRNMIQVGVVLVVLAVTEARDPCTVVYCAGCLLEGHAWLEHRLSLVSSLFVGVIAVEILGICFAQNLRSDVFAQRSRWLYQR